jgi:hypothetical protein
MRGITRGCMPDADYFKKEPGQKINKWGFKEEIDLSNRDIFALCVAAVQVIMPMVLTFVVGYSIAMFLIVKVWL